MTLNYYEVRSAEGIITSSSFPQVFFLDNVYVGMWLYEKETKNSLLRPHGCVAAHALRTPVLRLPGACGASCSALGLGGPSQVIRARDVRVRGCFWDLRLGEGTCE